MEMQDNENKEVILRLSKHIKCTSQASANMRHSKKSNNNTKVLFSKRSYTSIDIVSKIKQKIGNKIKKEENNDKTRNNPNSSRKYDKNGKMTISGRTADPQRFRLPSSIINASNLKK
jgi:hypothetical protein